MATFTLGSTKEKGCAVCGQDLFKLGGSDGQALVLKGSKGKIAVCSRKCGDQYEVDPAVAKAQAESAAAAKAKAVEKSKKRRKAKRK